MLLQLLAIALLFAEPAATPGAAPAPAPAAAPAPAPVAPTDDAAIFARIDTLMAAWKGKNGDRLRGRLGLSTATRTASDGVVMFWQHRSEATACGVDSAGNMSCGMIGGAECRLGVSFELDGRVKGWKASGAGEACEKFADTIGAP